MKITFLREVRLGTGRTYAAGETVDDLPDSFAQSMVDSGTATLGGEAQKGVDPVTRNLPEVAPDPEPEKDEDSGAQQKRGPGRPKKQT